MIAFDLVIYGNLEGTLFEKIMEPSPQKLSPLDFVAAILKGDMARAAPRGVAAMLMENRDLAMVLTTSVAVLIGCVVVLAWRRTAGSAGKKQLQPPKLVVPKPAAEPEDAEDEKTKVSVFFGTQTGTAEGFAKVGKRCYFIEN